MRQVVSGAVALITALCANAASAQQSAESLLRAAMAQRGIHSGVSYVSSVSNAYDPATNSHWNGLRASEAHANGGGKWTQIVVVQNFTSQPYCIRPRVSFSHRWRITGEQQGNQIVEPGAHIVVFAAGGDALDGKTSISYGFAYWRPDFSLPYSSQCRGVAPDGLDQWLADTSKPMLEFGGSRR